MPRFVNSDTRKIVVLPKVGVANPAQPSAAELNGAVDITCALLATYTLGATASDTVSEPSVCDTANANMPTRDNYAADLTLFRPTAASNDVYSAAKTALAGKGSEVWIYERISDTKGAADAFANGDIVSGYLLFLDNQLAVGGDAGWEKYQVQPTMAGRMEPDVAVGGVGGVPAIASITPATGLAAAGGDQIVVRGINFAGTTAVEVDGTPVDAAKWEYIDGQTVAVTVPAKSAGSYAVTVTTPAGESAGVNITYV